MPSSTATVRVPTASSSARSWEISSSEPGNACSADSSASRLSRSRWLVGSSSTSTLAPECTRIASDSRRRSPPESPSSGFSAASPLNRKRPSSARASLGLSPVERWAASSTVRAPLAPSSSACWESSPTLTLCPRRSLPAASSCSPVSVWISVVLPVPLGPISETCSPRSSHSSKSSSSVRSPIFSVPSSTSKITRPERSGGLKAKPSALAVARVALDLVHLVELLLRATAPACARVPARKRATKRSSRAISASCFSIARPSASSRAACSLRQACQVPLKKRARPPSSSSTEVPTASRNQRSCATSTTAASSVCRCASSHSSDSMSRWLVGSSSSSRSGSPASARASDARVSSPPENVSRRAVEVLVAEAEAVQRRVDALAPVVAAGVLEPRLRGRVGLERAPARCRPRPSRARARRGAPRARAGPCSRRARSRAGDRSRSRGGRWSCRATRTSLARFSSPPSTEVSPASIRSSVVLPEPLRPDSVSRSRRSSRNETPRSSGTPAMSLARSEAMRTAIRVRG